MSGLFDFDLELASQELAKILEESQKSWKHCFHCQNRCEPPFGDGKLCLVCTSKPTAECMKTVINI